jgi:hypothetical protein
VAATPQTLVHGQGSDSKTPPQTTTKTAPKQKAPAAKAKPAPAASSKPTASPSGADQALVAQGKSRYQAYGCKDCHGEHGEGTEDGPDFIGTHMDADQIAAMLKKPTADAVAKGMPNFAADSPDLKPLVAYVLSLKGSKAK